jgi:hypothetical protein
MSGRAGTGGPGGEGGARGKLQGTSQGEEHPPQEQLQTPTGCARRAAQKGKGVGGAKKADEGMRLEGLAGKAGQARRRAGEAATGDEEHGQRPAASAPEYGRAAPASQKG